METFKVKILQARKRLRIKEISASSIEEAEVYLLKLLSDFFETPLGLSSQYYITRSKAIRKFTFVINGNRISVQLEKKGVE